MFKGLFVNEFNDDTYGDSSESFGFKQHILFSRVGESNNPRQVPANHMMLDAISDPVLQKEILKGNAGYEGVFECAFESRFGQMPRPRFSIGYLVSTSYLYSIDLAELFMHKNACFLQAINVLKQTMYKRQLPNQRMISGQPQNGIFHAYMKDTNWFDGCQRMNFILEYKVPEEYETFDKKEKDIFEKHILDFINTLIDVANPQTIMIPEAKGTKSLICQIMPYLPTQIDVSEVTNAAIYKQFSNTGFYLFTTD